VADYLTTIFSRVNTISSKHLPSVTFTIGDTSFTIPTKIGKKCPASEGSPPALFESHFCCTVNPSAYEYLLVNSNKGLVVLSDIIWSPKILVLWFAIVEVFNKVLPSELNN